MQFSPARRTRGRRALRQPNSEAKTWGAAVHRRFVESLDQLATVRRDHTLRRDVVGVRRDLDERQSLGLRLGKKQLERPRRVASALFPGDDRVPDVAQTVWRKVRRSRLPTEAD